MSKLLYQYDPETGLLKSSFEAQIDVKMSKNGETVYLLPPNATFVKPPTTVATLHVAVFDRETNSWKVIKDYRGKQVANIYTKEIITWDKIGDIPENYTLNLYSMDMVDYIEWNGSGWVISGKGRKRLLDEIWILRKSKREQQCSSDLLYKDHMIHVDAVSFNDIMLAAQEALILGDMTTTKRWITADNIDVELNGYDFIQIARLYGERRQALVYESNEAWQQDTERSNAELVAIFKELKGMA